ncbi:MAG: nitrous oxide reductase family maturation protein NosD [Acidobacteriota bacterium]
MRSGEVVAGIVLLYYICSSPAQPGEIRVPQQAPTIRQALAIAQPGDCIRVHGGTYAGNLILSKPVMLHGEHQPVIRGDGAGSVVTVDADGCTLRGFLIERSGTGMALSDAGICLRSSGNTIQGNRIENCLFGMYLDRAGSNRIQDNDIQGMREREIGERGSGIHLYDSHNNSIEGNTVADARDGIYFDHANWNCVRWCSFTASRYGVHYMSSDDNTFTGNRFAGCMAGATIMFSRRLLFDGNWFVQNRGFSSVGALLKDCYDTTAVNNLFADNSTGMLLDNSMNNSFRRNEILRNDVALYLFSGSDANVFAENNFRENLSPIRLLGKRSTTRWSADGRGNYWSDYEGYDMDGDGIGDVPHKIQNVFEFLESEHPPLRFFLVSPVAAAMKAGEDAFPMFEFSREVDTAPLMHPVDISYGSRWRIAADTTLRLPVTAGLAGMSVCLAFAAGSRRIRRR